MWINFRRISVFDLNNLNRNNWHNIVSIFSFNRAVKNSSILKMLRNLKNCPFSQLSPQTLSFIRWSKKSIYILKLCTVILHQFELFAISVTLEKLVPTVFFLTHWLRGSNQHISLYFAITFIQGKPVIHREFVQFFVTHVIYYHLHRNITHYHQCLIYISVHIWADCVCWFTCLIQKPSSWRASVVVTYSDFLQPPEVWGLYCKLVLWSTFKVVFVTVQSSLPFNNKHTVYSKYKHTHTIITYVFANLTSDYGLMYQMLNTFWL